MHIFLKQSHHTFVFTFTLNSPEIWQVLVTKEVSNYYACCNLYVLGQAQGEGDGAVGLWMPLTSNF